MRTKKEVIRESFTTRMRPELISKLKHLAIDLKKPINHLLEESIEDFLKKHQQKK